MKLMDYFKENFLFILINLIIFMIVVMFMFFGKVNFNIIFIVFLIWFMPLISYIVITGIKKRNYYNNIYEALEMLDKKYLFPEVIKEPSFLEGEIINDILKVISRDMHENIKYYRDMQEEYKEYIETWVHEIKTPISSAKLIIENNKNDVTSKIDSQIDRIEYFVEQSLYYSRSEDISRDYVIKELDLNEAVMDVVKRNYRDFINKRIKIKLHDIDFKVYSDIKWIKFIINQLVTNSIKYSDKGSNSEISIYGYENEKSIILVVEDNGAGIPEKDIRRVFEKSFTGENGRKFGKGTGMGLYLCRKLCRKLSIGISIESIPATGTKVTLSFINENESILEKN